jgi:hypothetical protein
MKWLAIPAHRVLEVERHELSNEFDIYDEAGEKLCYRGTPTYSFVIRTARGLSSPSSVILKARPEEIASICRRSEVSLISETQV